MRKQKIIAPIAQVGIICAAIAVGGWSGVVLCDWLAPTPDHGVKLAVKASGTNTALTSVSTRTDAVRSAKPTKKADDGKWIADVWSGPRRTGAFRVAGISADGRIDARCINAGGARRGLGETIRRALRKRGKAPLEERYARRADDPFDTPEARDSRHSTKDSSEEEKGPRIYQGDVYLTGIPMVDQGKMPYCAVASAARVLQGYGIEVTMEDLAVLANSSPIGGTNATSWERAIAQVANEHGLKLNVVSDLTETKQPMERIVGTYNCVADELGYDRLNIDDYLLYGPGWQLRNYTSLELDREYPVQREVMLSDGGKQEAFDENVISRIDDSDPIFWTVTLGEVPEQTAYGKGMTQSATRGAHMRLIIGYNEERGEVLYSDSWGEGHELKRMDAADALSITTGMSYLTE